MSRDVGDIYEQHVEHICVALGYQVIKPTCGNQRSWDMVVNGKRVQVKKRCVDETKPNNIRLVTSLSSSEQVYDAADVDAFAIYWKDVWFVFPSEAIADADGVIRNGIYMPLVEPFKNRWEVLRGERVRVQTQSTLF